MDRIVAFIGPSMVGKTTVAKRLAMLIGEKSISTDTLCSMHSYHTDSAEESIELFDDLRDYVLDNNVKIVDIGANTIEHCGSAELKYLKKSLTINGNEPVFYYLLPSKSPFRSYDFLSRTAKKIYGENKIIDTSLKSSLHTFAYVYLNATTIYTLENYKRGLCTKKNTYKTHLEWTVTDTVLNDLLFDKLAEEPAK